jgi:hypothetical protein
LIGCRLAQASADDCDRTAGRTAGVVQLDVAYIAAWMSACLAAIGLVLVCPRTYAFTRGAGLLWNLDWRPGHGLTFAFTEQPWPAPSTTSSFSRVAWPALLFMMLVSVFIASLLPR